MERTDPKPLRRFCVRIIIGQMIYDTLEDFVWAILSTKFYGIEIKIK